MEGKRETKICRTCQKEYPKSNLYFYRGKDTIDGYLSECINCARKRRGRATVPLKISSDGEPETLRTAPDQKRRCMNCLNMQYTGDFFPSGNPHHIDGTLPMCRECLMALCYNKYGDVDPAEFMKILEKYDLPYIDSVLKDCSKLKDTMGKYFHKIYEKYKDYTYKDSKFDKTVNKDNTEVKTEMKPSYSREVKQPIARIVEFTEKDMQNKNDVLNILGYDPFDTEPEEDKPTLYNKLIDYLDDSTLEDNFKLPIVIEIVKSFSQIDKINRAISTIDTSDVVDNVAKIKQLTATKKDMMTSVLSMAKDNGISVNHSNNKSQGAGTLSGIIKNLQQKDIMEAKVNIFDIETCEGMRQVADISNSSIMRQLMLNESDYTDMIREQREMITAYETKIARLEEENRLLKIKVKEMA